MDFIQLNKCMKNRPSIFSMFHNAFVLPIKDPPPIMQIDSTLVALPKLERFN
jgi:hypothetical protein